MPLSRGRGAGAEHSLDARRTAWLLLDRPEEDAPARPELLGLPAVRTASAVGPVPPRGVRVAQRLGEKLGRRGLEPDVLAPARAAVRAARGARPMPPRVLVRFDEFPCYASGDEPERLGTRAFRRFHEVLRGADVPYLCAIVPTVSSRPLDPEARGSRRLSAEERATLDELAADPGTDLALHGLLHRVRDANPRRHSELLGLTPAEVEDKVDRGLELLGEHGVRPRTFVPPHNRFEPRHWGVLEDRFDVVSGGPESVLEHGLRPPQLWGDALWLPSLPPLYGAARDIVEPLRRLRGVPGDVPWLVITLHLGWELEDDLAGLRDLAAELAGGLARPWDELYAGLDRARLAVPA